MSQARETDTRGSPDHVTAGEADADIAYRLRAIEERFRHLVELSADWYWEQDAEFRFTYISSEIGRITGIDGMTHIGKTRWDLPVLNLSAGDWARHRAQLERHEPFRDLVMRRPDNGGRPLWVTASGRPVFDAQGRFAGYRGIGRDITDAVLAEERLRHAQAQAHAQREVLDLIARDGPLDRIYRAAIEYAEKLCPGTLATFLRLDDDGVHLRHGAAPNLPAAFLDAIDGVAIGPQAGSCGTAAYRRERVVVSDIASDPLWRQFRELALDHGLRACWSEPILSSTGAVLGTFAIYAREPAEPTAEALELIGTMTGLVSIAIERERSTRALQESESRLRAIIAQEPECVTLVDGAGRLLEMNAAGLRMVEADDPQKVIGRCVFDLVVDEHRDAFRQMTERIAAGGPGESLRFEIVGLKGTRRWLETNAAALRTGPGEPARLLGVTRDITEHRRQEEELRRLNETLEARVVERTAELTRANTELRGLVQEMEAFYYTVSHDLRAPVRAIGAFSRLLIEQEAAGLSGEGRRMLAVVENNARRMGEMVDNLLQLARINRAELQRERFDLRGLAQSCATPLADRHPQTALAFGAMPAAEADAALVRQLLVNLLENAYKFSAHAAAPRVEAGWSETAQAWYVRDNGVGFDMRYAGRLFGVFERLHTETEFPGTGIGLAIVKRIVDRHGGRVWAQSAPGAGATFYFTLAGGPAV